MATGFDNEVDDDEENASSDKLSDLRKATFVFFSIINDDVFLGHLISPVVRFCLDPASAGR